MSNNTEPSLVKDIKNLTLLAEASIEAIQHTLNAFNNYQSEDAIQFLKFWNEGAWEAIMDYYPEFDIKSEAQQALIKESGGIPT